jgi:hypothetical protein
MTQEREGLKTAKGETKEIHKIPEIIPKDFPSVHVDKAMVAIDEGTDTATLTLLAMHVVPSIEKDGWGLDNVRWEVVAEVKMPMPALNAVTAYYIQQVSGGLDIVATIGEYLREHPKAPPKTGISYGPTDIRKGQPEKPNP